MYEPIIGAAALLGLNMGFVIHNAPSLLLVMVVVFMGTSAFVRPLDTDYVFWVPLSYLLGVTNALFVANAMELKPLVSFDTWFRRPYRCWPVPLSVALFFGASVAWAMLPRTLWFPFVPASISALGVWMVAVLAMTGAVPRIPIRALLSWAALAAGLCIVAGLLEVLAPRIYVAAYVVGTLAVSFWTVRATNVISIAMKRFPAFDKVWRDTNDFVASVSDDSMLMMAEHVRGVAYAGRYE